MKSLSESDSQVLKSLFKATAVFLVLAMLLMHSCEEEKQSDYIRCRVVTEYKYPKCESVVRTIVDHRFYVNDLPKSGVTNFIKDNTINDSLTVRTCNCWYE